MPQSSAETVQQIWWTTLAVYAVVLLVVAVLLALIVIEARRIRESVSAVWTVGQKVANNTIHIALLDTTNHVVEQILASARRVAAETNAIKAHAERCPGCPRCVEQNRRLR